MRNLRRIGLVTILIINGCISANAQQQEEEKTNFSVEIDPGTFGLNGYSFHLKIQPKNCDHLLLGVGVYAMDMPDLFVDFNKNNKGNGWDVRLNQGIGLFAEHHFFEVNKKWFVGTQLSLQEYKIENEAGEGNEKFTNGLAMAYAGYTFQPFNFNLYIKPWAGVGYSEKLNGDNTLGNNEYDISPITMFATLHLGYTF